MKCPDCGNELIEGAKFCKHCGAHVEQLLYNSKAEDDGDMPQIPKGNNCVRCGAAIVPGNKFCINCGAPVADQNNYVKENMQLSDSTSQDTEFQVEEEPVRKRSIGGRIVKFFITVILIIALFLIAAVAIHFVRNRNNEGESEQIIKETVIEKNAAGKQAETADSKKMTQETADKATESENQNGIKVFQTQTEPQTETEPSTGNARIPMDFCGADFMEYPLSANEFATISSSEYTLMYPKNFFKTGYYDVEKKKYEFVAADGVTSLTVTEEEAPVQDDPMACANWLLNQYSQDFLVTSSCPYKFVSKKVSDSGYSRSVIAGPLVSNNHIGQYVVSACTNKKLYTLTLTYETNEADGIGFDHTPKGYVVDCVYRGWSISGSTYQLRTYDQYMADVMGEKKP